MALFTRCCPRCGEALVVRASAFGTRVGCGCRAKALASANDNTPQPPAAPAAYVAAVQVEAGAPVLALAA